MGTSYSQAGVNIAEGNRAVDLMKKSVRATYRPEVLTELGNFAGLFALNNKKYAEPVLVSGTDGVGTKLRIAQMLDKHDTIGIDAVAMCVNDILVMGAEPLFFLDYIAVGKLYPEKVADIVAGVAEGCKQANCSLIGGETAEMPGFYVGDDYDIAGFAVGVADKVKIITGKDIGAGDIVLALPSTGVHSNGFSLVRKVLLEDAKLKLEDYLDELGQTLGACLLTPTKIYVRELLPLCEQGLIKGMAHITGGGLIENVPRVLPEGVSVKIKPGSWPVPPIFSLLQKLGNIDHKEMHRVFNMGIGMVIIADTAQAEQIRQQLPQALTIGSVVAGDKTVILD
ncbi:MAG: phosphoribosylformylglycinamidine cyclo-ligase [Clostridia bacterium]|nr:phosphoribosylformylglycinamidine cyclo-ligase [Clostridia bacterium]